MRRAGSGSVVAGSYDPRMTTTGSMVAWRRISSRPAGKVPSQYLPDLAILFPSRYRMEHSRLRQILEEAHLAWQIEWKARQEDFVIENIRFAHDPQWRHRFFSIQS